MEILDGKPQTADGLVYTYLVKKTMQPFKVQVNPPRPKPVLSEKDQRPSTPVAKTTKGADVILYRLCFLLTAGVAKSPRNHTGGNLPNSLVCREAN